MTATRGTAHSAIQFELLNPSAAALNQNDQHDNKEDAGNDPDNRSCVHFQISRFTSESCLCLRHKLVAAPTGPSIQSLSLNPSAAALNQNDQHDDKEDAGNNPDNRSCVHLDSPFFQ